MLLNLIKSVIASAFIFFLVFISFSFEKIVNIFSEEKEDINVNADNILDFFSEQINCYNDISCKFILDKINIYDKYIEISREILKMFYDQFNISLITITLILIIFNIYGLYKILDRKNKQSIQWAIDIPPVLGIIGTLIGLSNAIYYKYSSTGGETDVLILSFSTASMTTVHGAYIHILHYIINSNKK